MQKKEAPQKVVVSKGKITKFNASGMRIDPNGGRLAY